MLFWGSMLGALPAGYLADRFGAVKLMNAGAAVSIICTFAMPTVAQHLPYFYAGILRFLMGVSFVSFNVINQIKTVFTGFILLLHQPSIIKMVSSTWENIGDGTLVGRQSAWFIIYSVSRFSVLPDARRAWWMAACLLIYWIPIFDFNWLTI